jgi:hypothetical protein
VLEFEVEARAVSIVYHMIKADMGMAGVQVDDGPAVKLNGWFSGTWGTWNASKELGRGLAAGKHRVRITLLVEKDAGSGGHRFEVLGVMVAGGT